MQGENIKTGAAHLASGGLLGLAFVHPVFAPAAWVAIAALVVALAASRSVFGVLLWTFAGQLLARAIAFPWVPEMNAASFDFEGWAGVGLLVGEWCVWSLPTATCIALGWLVWRRWAWPVLWTWMPAALWVPPAWALAERIRFEVLSLRLDDWLATQWTTAPVLKALGHLGWYPTLGLCLLAAGALGEAWLRRRAVWTLPLAGLAAGFFLLPALPEHTDRLEGLGAVHTDSLLAMPHGPPPGAPLAVWLWPEAALHGQPMLNEGVTRGARLAPMVLGGQGSHVVGTVTRDLGGRRRNQLVVLDAEGAVLQSRAKRLLFPVSERRFLGLGSDQFEPGRRSTVLSVAGRALIAQVCGEVMSRALVAEGVAHGGQVLAIAARDQMMVGERPLRQLLAVQVLRAVEFGVPSVRASFGGEATFVSAAGRVLARSGRSVNGILRWDTAHGARDHDFLGAAIVPGVEPERPPPSITVLFDAGSPALQTRCPEGRCRYQALQSFRCADQRAETVIVAGHSAANADADAPLRYLSAPPAVLAEAILCLRPSLVVLDVCHGAATELLSGIAPLDATVVAAPYLLPRSGFEYHPEFFGPGTPAQRAAAVQIRGGRPLLRGPVSVAAVAQAVAAVEAMDASALRARRVHQIPPHVRVSMPGVGPVLVPVHRAQRSGSP